MKIGIFYFSATGNTAWAVETLARILRMNCETVDLFNLEQDFPKDTSGYDQIGLAHPIYGANTPSIVLDKFRSISLGINTRLFIMTTFGYVNALGYFAEKKQLQRPIHSYFNLHMFNDVTTPKVPGSIPSLESRIVKRPKLEAELEKMADLILLGKPVIQGIAPYLIPGIIIRKVSSKLMALNYQNLSADPSRCNHCHHCVQECPTHTIQSGESGLAFSPKCTACMRCYNHCPKNAILINGIYADPEKYPRYVGPWK